MEVVYPTGIPQHWRRRDFRWQHSRLLTIFGRFIQFALRIAYLDHFRPYCLESGEQVQIELGTFKKHIGCLGFWEVRLGEVWMCCGGQQSSPGIPGTFLHSMSILLLSLLGIAWRFLLERKIENYDFFSLPPFIPTFSPGNRIMLHFTPPPHIPAITLR